MTKNTGKDSENEFERIVAGYGKKAFLHRFDDAAAAYGRTGVKGVSLKQPSDYLLTLNGQTHYAEVKSSTSKTSFATSQFEEGQIRAMRRQVAAGGEYWVYIHSIHLNRWFKVPASYLLLYWETKKSHRWDELDPTFLWRY